MLDLTNGPEGRRILAFAWPMLLGSLFQQVYFITDAIIIGHFLGTEALAATGASFTVIFVLISLMLGIASGINVIISQYFGNKNFRMVTRAIDTSLIFVSVASVGLSILGIIFSRHIFLLMGIPEEIIPDAITYFNIYVAGLIFMSGYTTISAILRGMGDSVTPLIFLILSTILNVGFDLLFVIVFEWGIAGISFATVLSQIIAFSLSIIYLNRHHPLIRFTFKELSFDRSIFRESLRIGVPTGLQHTFVSLGMLALMVIVNKFGTATIAAYTIAWRIESFATLPAMNLGMALSTFVGQNIGANKYDRIRAGFRATILINAVFSITVTAVSWIFGESLIGFFTNDPEVIAQGYDYLVIVSSFYLVFAVMFATHGLLRGAGDALVPMFITLMSLWGLRIPIAYFLSDSMGPQGIWWGISISWVFGFAATYIYYKTGRWKTKKVIDRIVQSEAI